MAKQHRTKRTNSKSKGITKPKKKKWADKFPDQKVTITWTPKQQKELSLAVKAFNDKRKRIIKNFPVLENILPPKMSVKGLKQGIERLPNGKTKPVAYIASGDDLKKTVRMLRSFSSEKNKIGIDKKTGEMFGIRVLPDNKYNTLVTDWQYEKMSQMASNVNKARSKLLDIILDLEMTDKGKPTGYTVREKRAEEARNKNKPVRMGAIDENGLLNTNPFNYSMDRTGLKVKFWSLFIEDKQYYWNNQQKAFRESAIKAIEEQFGVEKSQKLVARIESMTFLELYKIYSAEGLTFNDFYPLSAEEAEYQLARLEAIFL